MAFECNTGRAETTRFMYDHIWRGLLGKIEGDPNDFHSFSSKGCLSLAAKDCIHGYSSILDQWQNYAESLTGMSIGKKGKISSKVNNECVSGKPQCGN